MRVLRGVVWLAVVIAVVFVAIRVIGPREGTRSLSIATTTTRLRDARVSALLAGNAARKRCADPGLPLSILAVRGPASVVVRESAPGGTSLRFNVQCDTGKVTALGP